MTLRADVLIVGGGPAGLAAAIASRQKGLSACVVDTRMPPIDKPCGEGLLPQGVDALRELGIRLASNFATEFTGICFTDEASSVCAKFPGTTGFALRRVRLHQLLVDRASDAGVEFLWGQRVEALLPGRAVINGNSVSYRWLVGADGQHSSTRKYAGLRVSRAARGRFGFRRHFAADPWTNVVEVHWNKICQLVITPTGAQEIGVAVVSRDSRLRLEHALPLFPEVARKLRGTATTKELGDVTGLSQVRRVTTENVALVGDASGTVDAITGHGLSLAFQQALALASAFEHGDLRLYEAAHRELTALPVLMSRLILCMEAYPWIRRKALRLFANTPESFAKLLSIHAGALPLSSMGLSEWVGFGWKLLTAPQ